MSKQRVTKILADRVLPDRFVADGPRGVKMIADPSAAAEWYRAAALASRRPRTGPGGSNEQPPDLTESRARREAAEAALAEIELAEKEAELVPAADVEARLANVFTRCKTKLLGVPARARQQDPTLTAPQLALVEELMREALEELAEGKAEPARRARRKAAVA